MASLSPTNGDEGRRTILLVGGISFLGMALMYVLAGLVYFPAYTEQGRMSAPGTIVEWFELLRSRPAAGLFFLGFADVPIVILFILGALAASASLQVRGSAASKIAVALAIAGASSYLATNTSFSMLSLSADYATATTDAQRTAIEAAGHATIAATRGTGGIVGMELVWTAAMIFSILQTRTPGLGRVAGWVGIAAFSLLLPSFAFAGYTYGSTSPFGAAMAAITSLGGGLVSFVWYILGGIWLFRQAKADGGRKAGAP